MFQIEEFGKWSLLNIAGGFVGLSLSLRDHGYFDLKNLKICLHKPGSRNSIFDNISQ
jgi:hypothetical protein